jgi:hypothetical protein
MLVCEFAVFPANCRRAIELAVLTVSVAVVLLTLVLPLHVLVTRTQYDFVAVSAGVVNDALFVPTGVVVVPLVPSYH